MDTSEIADADSLKAWLNALPEGEAAGAMGRRQVACCIAMRMAARELPVWWKATLNREWKRRPDEKWARDNLLTALPALRCVALGGAATMRSVSQVVSASAAACNAGSSAYAAAEAFAVNDAAEALFTCLTASAVASAPANNPAPVPASIPIGRAVRTDCSLIAEGRGLLTHPLWPQGASPDDRWPQIKATLAERGEAEAWAYWTHWYDRLLDPQGQPPDADLWTEIALIDPEIWDAGPRAHA